MKCLACDATTTHRLYASTTGVSITSLGAAIDAPTHVNFCSRCGHLQTEAVVDTDAYYDQAYNINTASEDEDQLYKVVDGRPVFRSAHQSEAALSRVELPRNARVLDYGCGSGHIARAIHAQRADLDIHLFDISENYKSSWSRWISEEKTACYQPPNEWDGSFDLVLSFFALEHADAPRDFAAELFRLAKPGGQVYLVIPNTYQNVADLIVVDHLNHFADISLRWLFEHAGFELTYISDQDHDSAWTIVARKPSDTTAKISAPSPDALQAIEQQASDMASFWQDSDAKIAVFEAEATGRPATIYGSGFYGSYLHTRLAHPESVEGFVDRNPHQQKKKLFDKPIMDPADVPDGPRAIYVGLNPRVAKQAIAELDAWRDRPYTYFYL